MSTKYYTINHVNKNFYEQAHHTAARYPNSQSEFDKSGLSPEFVTGFSAPFVKESMIKMGLTLKEAIPIQSNGTWLIIGLIEKILLSGGLLKEDGYIDLEEAETVTGSALDRYHSTQLLDYLPYAKPK